MKENMKNIMIVLGGFELRREGGQKEEAGGTSSSPNLYTIDEPTYTPRKLHYQIFNLAMIL